MESFLISLAGGFCGGWLFYNKGRFKHALICLKYDRKRIPCIFGWHKWTEEEVLMVGQELTPRGEPVGKPFEKKGKMKKCKICPVTDHKSLKIPEGLKVVKANK